MLMLVLLIIFVEDMPRVPVGGVILLYSEKNEKLTSKNNKLCAHKTSNLLYALI